MSYKLVAMTIIDQRNDRRVEASLPFPHGLAQFYSLTAEVLPVLIVSIQETIYRFLHYLGDWVGFVYEVN